MIRLVGQIMYTEDDLLPISALQHLMFCPRQWGLIHLEQIWEENRLTVEGHHLHERAHDGANEVRGNLRIARGLALRSLRLGLTGKADVVEFHRTETDDTEYAIPLDDTDGFWKPLIVEYKRGKPKIGQEDKVQICAQALCLEEMLTITLVEGYIFYGKPRRRYEVLFDENLRQQTESLVMRLHEFAEAGKTPAAEYSKKCESCSLINACLPKTAGKKGNVEKYLAKAIEESPSIPL